MPATFLMSGGQDEGVDRQGSYCPCWCVPDKSIYIRQWLGFHLNIVSITEEATKGKFYTVLFRMFVSFIK